MKRPIVVQMLCALFVMGAFPRTANGQSAASALEPYLRGIDLDAAQLESAGRGSAVVRLLATGDEKDVAVFGMVRIRSTQDAILSRLLDLERSLKEDGRRFAIFHDPPQPGDVVGVSSDESEYGELRDCRPGDCRFKLPSITMRTFAQKVDWSAPDAKAQVDRLLREGLLEMVRDYRSRGGSAMFVYDDQAGVRSNDVFEDLATLVSRRLMYPPELRRYLTMYPLGRPKGARDFLLWVEGRAPRLRPTLMVHHVVGYTPPGPSGCAFVATKQIYASHYLDGALELLGVVDLESAGERSAFLLAVRWFRIDRLSRGPLNMRGRVEKGFLEELRSDLTRHKSVLEAPRVGEPPASREPVSR
jgi:hypothetical protein